ncbi:M28 family peptidase [Flavobacterium sp.]|uniref:M28 family peptidase n=1 Tax=Flavobacterium sp. TaxID=239 RepID=UPI002B4AF10D|nr:M28 family peptidase [Flavobacterium sp.]HLF52511.1 M28 family peptidase [Flavobacterium sp.]
MKRNYSSILSALFILGILGLIYLSMMPQWVSKEEGPLSEFSTKRTLEQVAMISKEPHYIGSENHKVVADYLEKELRKLGLETQSQEGTTLSDWGNLVKSKNILARIKGSNNSKALLLLSHYDSAPHSYSHGASDNAVGVATILEGIRTFLHNKTPHKNDIIILFSDAEELGLNGAALFVKKSNWAKDIGLVLNFEARGSAGPSYMLMEVNQGNGALVKIFSEANPKYPVSNSLMYSIYKMLPNDTDLTVFREQGNIQGFNFAFIDNHFNYHTAQDDFDHVSQKTVAHQGTYLMPLLKHFSNADLKNMNSTKDYVYFNIPFYFVNYPFSWIFPMLILAILLFLALVFIGIGKRILTVKEIGKGFLPLFGSLTVSGILTFLGWKIMLALYPQYNDILQGFTYNGHDYIAAFGFLSLAIGFLFYRNSNAGKLAINHAIAPLFLWIILNFAIAFALPGAGFFIIPVFFGLIMLGYFVITQKFNKTLNLILSIPALIIFVPFIIMFPIGLGLKILAGSAILTILVFGLLLPVLGSFYKKWVWSLLMFLISVGFFVNAHLHSGYEKGKAKPNSLLYVYDADKNKAVWATYDTNLDGWTKKYLSDHPKDASILNTYPLYSKYNSGFTFMADAPVKDISGQRIEFVQDSIIGNRRYLKIKITPQRLKVNRYDIYANEKIVFHNLKANGAGALDQKGSRYQRKGKKIISYYVVENEPLELQFSVAKNTVLDMSLMESSFDLMTQSGFAIAKRESWMMPMPFVLNDAVVIKQKIIQNVNQQVKFIKEP